MPDLEGSGDKIYAKAQGVPIIPVFPDVDYKMENMLCNMQVETIP